MPMDAAMEQIISEAGKQFDPQVVEILRRTYLDLELLAKSGSAGGGSFKLSNQIKAPVNGAAPAAGLEKGHDRDASHRPAGGLRRRRGVDRAARR